MDIVFPDITIASYNVLADTYIRKEYYQESAWPLLDPAIRIPSLIDRVFSLDTDVLCLQEVEYDLFRRLEVRGRACGYEFARWMHKGMGKPDGVATFVRDTLKAATSMNIEFTDGRGGKRSGHGALLTFLHKGPVVLNVVNTHFKWDPDGAPVEDCVGIAQARQLLNIVGHNVFAVICGDFNAQPGGPLLSAFADHGFRDAHPGLPPTFNLRGVPQKLDYILHRPVLKAYALPTPDVAPETILPSRQEPSDHVPIVAAFTVAK